VAVENGRVSVSSAEKLGSFQYDATHSPDLFPILAILAACAEGESKITGIRRLIHKESNRATSITDMLQHFGVNCKTEEDTLVINGQRALRAATIDSHNDHRIAMAAAIGALNADGPVTITNAHAVSKSYPDFFNHLASLGAQVEQKA
jgi:3-phosphoshikimate 1-carboxyvinyltransferase